MSLTPCELHEVTNCAFCTGASKAHEASLVEPVWDTAVRLPQVPGVTIIYSQFDGTCYSCSRQYPKTTPIFRPHNDSLGWCGVECCLMSTGYASFYPAFPHDNSSEKRIIG